MIKQPYYLHILHLSEQDTENIQNDGATRTGQFKHYNLPVNPALSVQQFFAIKNMTVVPTFLTHLIWTLPISSFPRTKTHL
jgi:hypothetical protein